MSNEESAKLEAEAVALVKQYGWALPKPVKEFMRRLAAFLEWEKLKGTV